MPKIKAVISDFDGTLFDTRRAICTVIVETFRSFGEAVPATAQIEATLVGGVTLEETLGILKPVLATNKGSCAEWVTEYRRIYNAGLGITSSTPFEKVGTMLSALKHMGVAVIVVSNKGAAAVYSTLKHFGFADWVQSVVAAESDLATKPNPRSFEDRIKPLFPALLPENYLVLGDTATDIYYARSIGAQVGWVTFGYGDPDVCQSLNPDYIVQSIPSVIDIVAEPCLKIV